MILMTRLKTQRSRTSVMRLQILRVSTYRRVFSVWPAVRASSSSRVGVYAIQQQLQGVGFLFFFSFFTLPVEGTPSSFGPIAASLCSSRLSLFFTLFFAILNFPSLNSSVSNALERFSADVSLFSRF